MVCDAWLVRKLFEKLLLLFLYLLFNACQKFAYSKVFDKVLDLALGVAKRTLVLPVNNLFNAKLAVGVSTRRRVRISKGIKANDAFCVLGNQFFNVDLELSFL